MASAGSQSQPYPPMIGRDSERETVQASLDQIGAGQGQLLLISGEPGIGKTRLAVEGVEHARERGIVAYWGHCFEWAGTPAYWPWIEILRDVIESHDPDVLRNCLDQNAPLIAQIVPELNEIVPDLPAVEPMNPEQARFRLFDGVTRLLMQLSRTQPLVLVFEDLHWADPASLLLLEFISHEVADAPLLIIATYRDVEVRRDHPLASTLGALVRSRTTQRLSLSRLERLHTAELIQEIAGVEPSGSAIDNVYVETEGNPFFATEVIRLLSAQGYFAGVPQAGSLDEITIPESVREVIGRQLDRLSAECNEVLQVASVIGREFDLQVLQTVCGSELDVVLSALDEAINSRMVEERSRPGSYRFAHTLIQEALYEEVSTSRRYRLHGLVGETLEREHGNNLAPHYADLARHFRRAPFGANLEKAIDYAERAGDQVMELVAWESAVGHYGRAVELLETDGNATPERLCDLLLKLGEAQGRAGVSRGTSPGAGNAPVMRETYWKAARIARESGLVEHTMLAVLGICGPNPHFKLDGKEFEALKQLMHETYHQLPASDKAVLARFLAWMGRQAYLNGTRPWVRGDTVSPSQRAAEWSEQSIAMARRLNDPHTIAFTLYLRPEYYQLPVDQWLDQELEIASEFLENARLSGDQILVAWSLIDRYGLISERFGKVSARPVLDELEQYVDPLELPLFKWYVALCRGADALELGRYDEAGQFIQQMEAAWPNSLAGLFQQFMLHRERGDHAGMARELERYEYGPQLTIFPLRTIYASDTGDREQLQSLLRSDDMNELLGLPRVPNKVRWLTIVAEACFAADEISRAQTMLDELEPFESLGSGAGHNDHSGGSYALYPGMLASLLQRWDDAERYLTFALAQNEKRNCQPYVAYTKYAWADMLLRRNEAGDWQRAKEFLAESKSLAEQIGMIRLLRLIDELEQREALQPAPEQTKPSVLSPRELDVLKLLVESKSDREIADELYISHHTVMRHVSNILRKLDVDSRGAAAVYAVRKELV